MAQERSGDDALVALTKGTLPTAHKLAFLLRALRPASMSMDDLREVVEKTSIEDQLRLLDSWCDEEGDAESPEQHTEQLWCSVYDPDHWQDETSQRSASYYMRSLATLFREEDGKFTIS